MAHWTERMVDTIDSAVVLALGSGGELRKSVRSGMTRREIVESMAAGKPILYPLSYIRFVEGRMSGIPVYSPTDSHWSRGSETLRFIPNGDGTYDSIVVRR